MAIDQQKRDRFAAMAVVIKALAHPSRLIMVDALVNGELCVCELRDLVGADLSTVSKHLTVLKNAGLVVDRKQGVQVYYRLQVPCILKFMDCIMPVLEAQACRCNRVVQGDATKKEG